MKNAIARLFILAIVTTAAVSTASAQVNSKPRTGTGTAISDLLIEDSLTPAKKDLRNYIAELRDTLVKVESVWARIQKERGGKKSGAVLFSQGRELARNCIAGAAALDLAAKRIEPMHTPNEQGDLALHSYRSAMSTLREELTQCAHFDSLTIAVKPLDDQKLDNIATAARDSIMRYDIFRDALIKLMGITLPVSGRIYHQ